MAPERDFPPVPSFELGEVARVIVEMAPGMAIADGLRILQAEVVHGAKQHRGGQRMGFTSAFAAGVKMGSPRPMEWCNGGPEPRTTAAMGPWARGPEPVWFSMFGPALAQLSGAYGSPYG